jgi:hypothetical protein
VGSTSLDVRFILPKADIFSANTDVRFGSKQTFAVQKPMSALTPKADMCRALADVRYGPKADRRSFDYLVGTFERRD